jgi:hypothetical protein
MSPLRRTASPTAGALTVLTALGALSALLLAGCSAAGPAAALPAPRATATVQAAQPAAQIPASVLNGALQPSLPIAAYQPTPALAAQAKYLDEGMTQICMQKFGFDYDPALSTAMTTQSVSIDQEFQSRMYGVSDPVAVHTYGYHLPSWTQGSAAPELVSDFPPAELSALEGTAAAYHGQAVPQGGCRGWAASQLSQHGIDPSTGLPDDTAANSLVAQIQTNTFDQAQADPRVLKVFSAWSACMRTHGDDYQTPFAAAADPRWTSSAPSAQEIAVAEQDIACKTQVNLLSVEFTVVSGYQNTAIAQNAAVLSPLKAQLGTEATTVARLTAQYPR